MLTVKRKHYLYLALAALPAFVILWFKIYVDPAVYFLTSPAKAEWIVFPEEFSLFARPHGPTITSFRTTIIVDSHISNPKINIKVFKLGKVFVDGKLVHKINNHESEWKKPSELVLETITPGKHELTISVENNRGPPALLVYSDDLGLYSNETWMANRNQGAEWLPAMLADTRRIAEISGKFQSTTSALVATLPTAVLVIMLYFAGVLFTAKFNIDISTGNVRWMLIILYAFSAANSVINAGPMGFDYRDHIEYIKFIAHRAELPLATDGFQMFQSPLYYIVSAMFFKASLLLTDPQQSLNYLTIIPLLCGLALIEICYRTSLHAFPDREDLQKLCTIVGAFLPMNLYMSQYLGNEPLAAVFTALAIMLTVSFLNNPKLASDQKQQLYLGTSIGLALLSKVTAVLLIPPVLFAFFIVQLSQHHSIKRILLQIGGISLVVIAVCGWYYIRNWILLGKPFVGGWDPSRGMAWWQDPGYRTFKDLSTFGYAFAYPVYAATAGFWDAIYSTIWLDGFLGGKGIFEYRTPWNYSYMIAGVWLAIVPTAGILTGMVYSLTSINKAKSLVMPFATVCIAIYFAAVLYLYIVLPVYSTAKATYTLGLLPCYAVLCAYGLAVLMKNVYLKHLFTGAIVLWAAYSYIAYFYN